MKELNSHAEVAQIIDLLISETEDRVDLLLFNSEWPELAAAFERTRDYLDDLKRIKGIDFK